MNAYKVKLGSGYDALRFASSHRFERMLPQPYAIEAYEPRDRLRWIAFVVAVVGTVLGAML